MKKIAVLIPCYNEEVTIKKVINDFQKELSEAEIVVYDNNSTDDTFAIAKAEGATVKKEPRQGKGHVVRSMFREIDADIYVLVDGDDTYPAESVHELIRSVTDGEADMAVGDRHSSGGYEKENKRVLHNFGNKLVKNLINRLFDARLVDIMSGYRAFSRRFVKNFPVTSGGFEIETEMSLHALDKKFLIAEKPIMYRDRPEGSYSKLDTFGDGFRVLKTILWVFKDYKPLTFFTILSGIIFVLGIAIGTPVIVGFIETGEVAKIPSAILSASLMMISVISLFSGFILDTIVKHQKENFELWVTRFNDEN